MHHNDTTNTTPETWNDGFHGWGEMTNDEVPMTNGGRRGSSVIGYSCLVIPPSSCRRGSIHSNLGVLGG
jgi:hypothetical protein